MQLSEFDFPFDSSLIASHPSLPRDHARLLVLQRLDRSLAHRRVDELPDLLQPGDLLVVNNTKVLAARVAGRKRHSGAEVEILFVKDLGDAIWEVLIKGTFRPGQSIEMGGEAVCCGGRAWRDTERRFGSRVRFRCLNGCGAMVKCRFRPT